MQSEEILVVLVGLAVVEITLVDTLDAFNNLPR